MVAVAVAGGLTATKLNEKLAANGLPDATITKTSTVSSVDSALSAGGAAEFVGGKVGSRSPDRRTRCSLGRGERVLDNSARSGTFPKFGNVSVCARETEREREREREGDHGMRCISDFVGTLSRYTRGC